MTPERWRRVKEVFGEALLAEPGARAALLAAACRDDHELRTTVDRLLAAHAGAADFMEQSPVRGLAVTVASQGRLTGKIRGSYRLGPRIGAGGTGEVYKATDIRTGRGVAIKVLTDEGVDAARRLTREARHAAELAHPNICEIYEVVNDAEGAFIAMELLDGLVLSDAVPSGGYEPAQATELTLQLAAAIAHAHAHAIVHRDLKCANLMLLDDGRLKVLDFGLARRLPESIESAVSAASMTDAGAIAGTISYLAPELLRGERADARSDVWACGIVLHELLTGEQPFEGRTPFELTSTVLREPPRPLTLSVPAGLRTIRDNCLAKDPAHRYQNGGEWLAALEAYKSGKRVKTHVRPVRRERWMWAAAAAVVALLATAVGFIERHGAGSSVSRKTSVAVLPLQGDGAGREPSYFADGVTEALIERLGTIDSIRVLSRTSTARYGPSASSATLRHDLNADLAVRGTVETPPGRVRLVLAVVDTATDRAIWQRTYDRRANEVLALENDAVREMVEAMGIELPSSRDSMLRVARAVDPVVYENYLKGRFYWNKRTDGSLEQAAAFYRAAIDLDPSYAPAHAALADCYNQLGTVMVGKASPAEMRPRARAEAVAAIQADESLAEAHATLGYIAHYDWEWTIAEREFTRAIELNPNLALAHVWYANYLASTKQLDRAVAQVRQAEQLDPFSLVVVTNVGWTLSYARRSTDAIAAYRRALALDPSYIQARMRLASELATIGRFDEAIAETRKVVDLARRGPSSIGLLTQMYARAGMRPEAKSTLNELIELSGSQYVSPVSFYATYFWFGDADKGFEWLDRAIQERSNGVAYIAVDSFFDPFRTDPRYRRVLDRIGLANVR
jgi:TolB-like protein/tetratricopeptide (TPR) repeat protein